MARKKGKNTAKHNKEIAIPEPPQPEPKAVVLARISAVQLELNKLRDFVLAQEEAA